MKTQSMKNREEAVKYGFTMTRTTTRCVRDEKGQIKRNEFVATITSPTGKEYTGSFNRCLAWAGKIVFSI